jgi:hypothetical protein
MAVVNKGDKSVQLFSDLEKKKAQSLYSSQNINKFRPFSMLYFSGKQAETTAI